MTRRKEIILNELKSSQESQRLFFKSVASSLLKEATDLSLKGTKNEIKIVAEVFKATKEFHHVLKNPDSSLDEILNKLEMKHATSEMFEKSFDISWSL